MHFGHRPSRNDTIFPLAGGWSGPVRHKFHRPRRPIQPFRDTQLVGGQSHDVIALGPLGVVGVTCQMGLGLLGLKSGE